MEILTPAKATKAIATTIYPEGTYAYFSSEQWPVIPRYFRVDPLKLKGDRSRP